MRIVAAAARYGTVLAAVILLAGVAGCDSNHKPEETVTVEITNVEEGGDAEFVEERLEEIVEDIEHAQRDTVGRTMSKFIFMDEMTVKISPIVDVAAFAAKIDFGTVTVKGRTVSVQLESASNADLLRASGDTVVLEIAGVEGKADADFVEESLDEMSDSLIGHRPVVQTLRRRGGSMTVRISPVANIETFARAIEFGEVTAVNGNTVTMRLTSHTVTDLHFGVGRITVREDKEGE